VAGACLNQGGAGTPLPDVKSEASSRLTYCLRTSGAEFRGRHDRRLQKRGTKPTLAGAPTNVCYWGKTGHRLKVRTCRLLTHGHLVGQR
jgi:hypothetical protein